MEYVWFEPKPDYPTTTGGDSLFTTTSIKYTTTDTHTSPLRAQHTNRDTTTTTTTKATVTHVRGTNLVDHTTPTTSTNHHLDTNPLPPLQPQTIRTKRMKHSDMGGNLHEGFIMSAGLDQRVFLWNLTGKCVGLFGAYGWDIGNESTWFKGKIGLFVVYLY